MRRKLHVLEDRLGLASGSESSSYRLAFTFSMVLGSDQLSQLPTFEVRERLVAKDRFGGVEQCESDWPILAMYCPESGWPLTHGVF